MLRVLALTNQAISLSAQTTNKNIEPKHGGVIYVGDMNSVLLTQTEFKSV